MLDLNVNYQCPACTGPLHFDGNSGKLVCEHCNAQYSVEEIEKKYGKKVQDAEKAAENAPKEGNWDVSSAGSDWGADGQKMKAYSCPSCGAELICDDTTAATSCPYCGNPTVIPAQFGKDLKPDFVIPFKLDKKAAVEALKKHYQGKSLLPKPFRDENHIEEVKGVYVPFWLFDGRGYADVTFQTAFSHTHTEGKDEVRVTDHYANRRCGSVDFQNLPVDGSAKTDDNYMNSLEPFDYNELKPFSMAYLPGYLADRYDQDASQCVGRANDRMKQTTIDTLRNTVHTGIVEGQQVRTAYLEHGKAKYALMPVWMLSTKWQGKNYLFMVNGQTGKTVGDLPSSNSSTLAMFGVVFAAAFAVLSIIFSLL